MQFTDLKAQYAALKTDIDARIHRVLDHGQYIMGPEVAELETYRHDQLPHLREHHREDVAQLVRTLPHPYHEPGHAHHTAAQRNCQH